MNRWIAAIVLLMYIGSAAAVVDLNAANQDTLEELNGIGPARAQAIIEYRHQHGPFLAIEQLLEVKGIGPGILERLRPQIGIGQAAPAPVRKPVSQPIQGNATGAPRYFGDTPPH